jgi:hypothetical protein
MNKSIEIDETLAMIVSAQILAQHARNGADIRAAVDAVLGEGTFAKLAGDVYDALRARAA